MSSIIINIAGNYDNSAVKKAQKSLDELQGSADRAGGSIAKAFERSGAALGKVSGKFRTIGQSLTYSLSLPLAGVGATAVQTAADFSKAMNLIAATTDASASQMQDFDKAIRVASQNSIYTLTEVANAALALARAGMTPAQQSAGALKAALDLAAASGSELSDSLSTMVNSMAAFGLTADQASTVADALAGAANASTANVDDLAKALAQVSSTATMTNNSLNETVGTLAYFAQVGMKGSDPGTSLKTFLLRLGGQTEAAKKAMQDYNLVFYDAQGNFRTMTDIADELYKKLRRLSQVQRSRVLYDIFGQDAIRAAQRFADVGSQALVPFINATLEAGAASDTAKAATQGAAGALASLRKNVVLIQESLGRALAPVVERIAQGISKLADQFASLSDGTKTAIVAIGAFLAAIGPAALMLSGVADALKYVAVGFAAVSDAAVVAAAKTKGAFVYMSNAAGMVKQGWKEASTVGSSALAPALTNISAAFKGLFSGDMVTAKAALEAFMARFSKFGSMLLRFGKGAGPIAAVIAGIAAFIAILKLAWDKSAVFRNAVSGAFVQVRESVSRLQEAWARAFDGNKRSVQMFSTALTAVGKIIGGYFGNAIEFVTMVIRQATYAIEHLINWMGMLADKSVDVASGLVGVFTKLGGWIPKVGDHLVNARKAMEQFNNAAAVAPSMGEHAGDRIKERVTDLTSAGKAIREVADNLTLDASTIEGALEKMLNAAAKALDKFKDKAKEVLDYRRQIVKSIVDTARLTADSQSIVLPSEGSILGNLQAQLSAIRKFAGQLEELRKLGLGPTALEWVYSAGPVDGGLLASALLEGGQNVIGQVRGYVKQLRGEGARVAETMGLAQFGMTGAQAAGIAASKAVNINGDIIVQFGAGVSAADRAEISASVKSAVAKALDEARKEAIRK